MRINITLIFLFYTSLTFAQKRTYNIIAFDDVVGEATITKKIINTDEYQLFYTFDAAVKVLFVKTLVDMDVKVNYVKNQIHYCKVNYKTNDKLFEREYVWNKSAYNVTTDKKASTLTKKAYYSVMNFYEKEPIGVKEVFLEKQNVFAPLKVLGNHKYSVMVDGDECTYTYKNGILQELYVDGMIDIHLKIK